MSRKSLIGIVLLPLGIVLTLFLYLSGLNRDPLTIGVVASLSKNHSFVGTNVRDGVRLAVEQWNARGGIQSRPVDVIVRNDEANVDRGIFVVKNLIEQENVDIVIGPVLSSMAPVVTAFKDSAVLFASPTMSTHTLSIAGDNFIRFDSPTSDQTKLLSQAISSRSDIRSIAFVYDNRNSLFTEELLNQITDELTTKKTVEIGFAYQVNSGTAEETDSLVQMIVNENKDALCIFTNAIDFAHIAQAVRQQGYRGQLYGGQWAATNDLITYGGNTVEGAHFVSLIPPDSSNIEYREFRASMMQRFGKEPTFINQLAYETAQIILETAARTGETNPLALRDSIISHGVFRIHGATIEIDHRGDTHRQLGIFAFKNGQFIPIDSL